jgi:hypothetical protein
MKKEIRAGESEMSARADEVLGRRGDGIAAALPARSRLVERDEPESPPFH